jgi:hypothetical protein
VASAWFRSTAVVLLAPLAVGPAVCIATFAVAPFVTDVGGSVWRFALAAGLVYEIPALLATLIVGIPTLRQARRTASAPSFRLAISIGAFGGGGIFLFASFLPSLVDGGGSWRVGLWLLADGLASGIAVASVFWFVAFRFAGAGSVPRAA